LIKRKCEICQHLPREHILEALYNISRILSGQAGQQQMLIGVLDALEQQPGRVGKRLYRLPTQTKEQAR